MLKRKITEPTFKPQPIIFESKQQEEEFEKWLFNPTMSEDEKEIQKQLNELRRVQRIAEKEWKLRKRKSDNT